ncbi:ABC transporter substrate-binding protein [Paracoccus sp. (in: a-proteobacteria)]|uniref:ABC transporter substrate-binding protein n=1 Tax=Paracoccus sp. TaxID=267 RepID=UPI00272B6617|nr:ABC transporter substrate-binding protein [Paracoccus sp. (in: a-proteobacteria)]
MSLSRRSFLGSVMAGLAAPALAQQTPRLRVGAVLPIGGPDVPMAAANLSEPARAALEGLTLSTEDAAQNAGLFGGGVDLLVANAPSVDAVRRAAERLVAHDRISVLVGGFTAEDATAMSEVAQATGTLFLNIAAPQDALRRSCDALTFHIEASAAMYLDALAGWFVRAGHRRWLVVHSDDADGRALMARLEQRLGGAHWGARLVDRIAVQPASRDFRAAARAMARTDADMVVLLTDWMTQLDLLAAAESVGTALPVTGFPWAAAQTRWFYGASRQAAPETGRSFRAALWEPTLDAYGARELNARYAARWGRPMDAPAWAGYEAVKIATEANLRTSSLAGRDLATWLADPATVFDLHKGIGASFRPWDRQLRQSLYLVQIASAADGGTDLERLRDRAALTGELPAIYMPGTDPIERLDQIGDMARDTPRCG